MNYIYIMKNALLLIFITFIFCQNECQNGRYIDELYDVDIQYQVQYGQNVNQTILGSQVTENLYMNIYYPSNDDFDNRPLIFFLFGGSFVSGSKSSSDIVALCTKYASRGYVAVAIDYRLSQHLLLFNANEENAYKAVMKAIHDLKAAIRYFNMNDELYDDYKIDINRIFAGGYSAGAVTAINAAYLNEYDEIPSFLYDDYDSFGGLEGSSGNQGYNSNFHGIVNLSGAVGNQEWIIENDVPIVSMHGDQDETVPYDENLVTLFGLNIVVDGSYVIHQRMLELGNYSSLHTYENQGHSPYTNMNFEADFSSSFLYDIVCESNIMLGDLNEDSIINVSDIVLLINLILSGGFIESGDLNLDENINVQDIVLLVQIILNN